MRSALVSAHNLQLRADLPKVRKDRLRQCSTQVPRPRGSACSFLHPNRPLHHLHVPVTPLLHPLIEVNEALAQLGAFWIAAIDLNQDLLDLLRRFDCDRHVAMELSLWNRVAFAGEV